MGKLIFTLKDGKISIETMLGKPQQIIVEKNKIIKPIFPLGFDEMRNELWRIYQIFKIVRPPDEFVFDSLTLIDEGIPEGYTLKGQEYLPLSIKVGPWRAWVLQKTYTGVNRAGEDEKIFVYPTGMWINEEKLEVWVQEMRIPKSCCA